jgi:hypothetical protein
MILSFQKRLSGSRAEDVRALKHDLRKVADFPKMVARRAMIDATIIKVHRHGQGANC